MTAFRGLTMHSLRVNTARFVSWRIVLNKNDARKVPRLCLNFVSEESLTEYAAFVSLGDRFVGKYKMRRNFEPFGVSVNSKAHRLLFRLGHQPLALSRASVGLRKSLSEYWYAFDCKPDTNTGECRIIVLDSIARRFRCSASRAHQSSTDDASSEHRDDNFLPF
jgi:hypothetical protein